MASLVSFGRIGRVLLPLMVVGVLAGCAGGDGESVPPSSSPPTTSLTAAAQPAGLEANEFGIVDSSVFTDAFYQEITENDVEVIEGDAGTSYRYVFPTRELSDGVSFALEARWDPVEDGLEPSLTWNLTGDGSSPSDFVFAASIPKSFAETVDDIVFDPAPDEVIDPDPIGRWEFDATRPFTISAIADALVAWPRAGGDVSLIPLVIMATLNDHRIHSELSACARFSPGASILISDAEASGLMMQCYLRVVVVNASTFGGESCAKLGEMIGTWGDNPAFVSACQSVVQLGTGGSAAAACDRAPSPSQQEDCRTVVWGLLAGDCPSGDPVEQQICLYDAAAAVGDVGKCDYLARAGSPEMANDCRATISKDPSYCAKIDDVGLRASCCEVFRGTDSYETCLGDSQDTTTTEATANATTTTLQDATTTEAPEESTTTEPGDEDLPPAIPAGVYTGSFDQRILIDITSMDSGKPDINSISITIDDEGLISGDIAVHQEGYFMGCPGAESDWTGTIDSGQVIGPTLPHTVTATLHVMEADPFDAGTWNNSTCVWPPAVETTQSSAPLVFEDVHNAVISGLAGDYLPFTLELVP